MLLDGTTINIGIAFLAGLVSFFAPCVIPLLPVYLGYLAGETVKTSSATVMRQALLFVTGFLLVFFLLGLGATGIGHLLALERERIAHVGGVLMVFLGLYLLEWIPIPSLYAEHRLRVGGMADHLPRLRALFMGITFGCAWTPCIGPVLAVILLLASQAGTAWQGGLLLLVYGAGIATPFLLVSMGLSKALPWLQKTARLQVRVQRVAGVLILLLGVGLLTNMLGALTHPIDTVRTFLGGW